MTRRYALYFAPPEGSGLEAFGRSFLGRDHLTGETVDQLAIDGLDSERLKTITTSARHYGFHATLKAPFELKEGCDVDDLRRAAQVFAQGRNAFEAPPLKVSTLSRWIAFTLSEDSPAMNRLAADCVRDFEQFRAPLSEGDIARRRKSGLTPRQDEQMLAYGYPYIFDDFHFHMTLAGPLDVDVRDSLVTTLQPLTSAIEAVPLKVDAIALYEQPDRDSPFVQTGRFPFKPA
jgi:putative phosphonate metabolism protein